MCANCSLHVKFLNSMSFCFDKKVLYYATIFTLRYVHDCIIRVLNKVKNYEIEVNNYVSENLFGENNRWKFENQDVITIFFRSTKIRESRNY